MHYKLKSVALTDGTAAAPAIETIITRFARKSLAQRPLPQRERGRPRAQARGGGEGGVLSLFAFFSSPSSIAVWALGFDAAGFPIASCGSQRFPGPPFSRPRRLVPGAPEFCFRQQSLCRHCARPALATSNLSGDGRWPSPRCCSPCFALRSCSNGWGGVCWETKRRAAQGWAFARCLCSFSPFWRARSKQRLAVRRAGWPLRRMKAQRIINQTSG